MIVRYMNHDHPATKAALITSDAMRRTYFEARIGTQASCSKKQRCESLAALKLSERVHFHVTETLKSTPDAWINREVTQ
jgi:hypothetical protein